MGPAWFGLGDRDIATHVVRTQMLDAGYPLSQVTAALCSRWGLPDLGVRLLPMSDDRVETHVVIDDPEAPGGRRAVHFQEYWVRLHAVPDAHEIVAVGAEDAKPGPGVLEAFATADLVLLPPSNPVVSIGTVLSVPGLRDALVASPAPVVGLSPIVGGAPVRGMADRVLAAIGVETSAAAVALHYGAARRRRAAGRLAGRQQRRRRGRGGRGRRHRLPGRAAADAGRAVGHRRWPGPHWRWPPSCARPADERVAARLGPGRGARGRRR